MKACTTLWLAAGLATIGAAACGAHGTTATLLTETELANTRGGVVCETPEPDDTNCSDCIVLVPLFVSAQCDEDQNGFSCFCQPGPVGYTCSQWGHWCGGQRTVYQGPFCFAGEEDENIIDVNDCQHSVNEAQYDPGELEECDGCP